MSTTAQLLRQADALKANVSDSTKNVSETWVTRQKLEDLYKKLLLMDLEYALDKKVEQELWNNAFKNQINTLQAQTKDKQNPKRAEVQASLNLFLETASGFYLQLLQLICTTFKLDLPFRRKSSCYGIIKEKFPLRIKITQPKKSSCLYFCQHCLVHLGDIARYRQQIEQAQTFYWHAANLVPFNGQPYNQLAIVEAARGNKLTTVFYYIRSLAVRHPFPVAATNLEKLYSKIARDLSEYKGKLSVSEVVTAFLQFHAIVHLCTDFPKAAVLCEKLLSSLPAHITSQSFPSQVLIQMVAINIYAMHHIRRQLHTDTESMMDTHEELSRDEERGFELVFNFTIAVLELLLQYTPKQEQKIRDFFTLPVIKLIFDWLKLNPDNLNCTVIKASSLWSSFSKVLNNIQPYGSNKEGSVDTSKYQELPLPEDAELRCFQPIEKAHIGYSFSRVPSDGLPSEVEIQLRCERLLAHGTYISEEFPGLNLLTVHSVRTGKMQFNAPSSNTRISGNESPSTGTERKLVRQNVAIQAIIQRQNQSGADQKSQEKKTTPKQQVLSSPKGQTGSGKGLVDSTPKYLLGVPTSDPQFMKPGRQSSSTPQTGKPDKPASPANSSPLSGNISPGKLVLNPNKQQTGKSASVTFSIPPTCKAGAQSEGYQQVLAKPNSSVSNLQQKGRPGMPVDRMQLQQQQQQPRKNMSEVDVKEPHFMTSQQKQSVLPPDDVASVPALLPQDPLAELDFDLGKPPPWPSLQTDQQGPPQPFGMSSVDFMNKGPRHPMHKQSVYDPSYTSGQKVLQFQPRGMGMNQPLPDKGSMLGPQSLGIPPMSHGSFLPHQKQVAAGDRHHMTNLDEFGRRDLLAHMPAPLHQQRPQPCQTRPNYNQAQQFVNLPKHMPPGHVAHPIGSEQFIRQACPRSKLPTTLHGFSQAPGTERFQIRPPQIHQSLPSPTADKASSLHQHQSIPPPGGGGGPHQAYLGPTKQFPPPRENAAPFQKSGAFVKPEFETSPQECFSKFSIESDMAQDKGLIFHGLNTIFQGHAEGTPKPERGSVSVPSVAPVIGPEPDRSTERIVGVTPVHGLQPAGTYSLFSSSPWSVHISSTPDTKSLGSSPFSSQASSMRNSPEPASEGYQQEPKVAASAFDIGLKFNPMEDRWAVGKAHSVELQNIGPGHGPGPYFSNNLQSIWSAAGPSPLEKLLELQRQQRQTDPH
ncbi:hypothetical protein ScPMuIL_010533 [Solemya velum]